MVININPEMMIAWTRVIGKKGRRESILNILEVKRHFD